MAWFTKRQTACMCVLCNGLCVWASVRAPGQQVNYEFVNHRSHVWVKAAQCKGYLACLSQSVSGLAAGWAAPSGLAAAVSMGEAQQGWLMVNSGGNCQGIGDVDSGTRPLAACLMEPRRNVITSVMLWCSSQGFIKRRHHGISTETDLFRKLHRDRDSDQESEDKEILLKSICISS